MKAAFRYVHFNFLEKEFQLISPYFDLPGNEKLNSRGKKKNRIQKRTFLLPFFWRKQKQTQSDAFLFPFSVLGKQKRNSKSCIPFSFIWRKHKTNSECGFLFPFSEESIYKGNCKSCNPYSFFPFLKKTKKEFGMMDFIFLFSHKNKTGNWICLYPPGSHVPTLSLHANRFGNEATLQEYPVALD